MFYYAGHGSQIGSENYLWPTKCDKCKDQEFKTEYDVQTFGVNVKDILGLLKNYTNKLDIIILDACRDNGLEATRSGSSNKRGLAEITPPSGSLIAFSTDANQVALDGKGGNSLYCLSLVKYIQKEGYNLTQVFNSVRAEIESATNGDQSPIEENKLINTQNFYFKTSNYETELNLIDSLIDLDSEESLMEATKLTSVILSKQPNNKRALFNEFEIYSKKNNWLKAEKIINELISRYPFDNSYQNERGKMYVDQEKYDLAISEFSNLIDKDSDYINAYNNRGHCYSIKGEYEKALIDYNKCVELEPDVSKRFKRTQE